MSSKYKFHNPPAVRDLPARLRRIQAGNPEPKSLGISESPTHNTSLHRSAVTRKKSNIRRSQNPTKPSCGQAAQNGGPASGVNGSGRRNKQKAFTFVPPGRQNYINR